MATANSGVRSAAGDDPVARHAHAPHTWLRRALAFWRGLERPIDYPEQEAEWRALIDAPVPLHGPFDWGLAVGRYGAGRGRRMKRTPLGDLMWSYRQFADPRAAEILSALLARFLRSLEVETRFDVIVPVPPSFASRDVSSVRGLLTPGDSALPLPVRDDLIARAAAIAPQRRRSSAFARHVRNEKAFRVDAGVRGLRVLIVDDLYDTGETASALAHALRERGAAAVGVLAICVTGRCDDDQ